MYLVHGTRVLAAGTLGLAMLAAGGASAPAAKAAAVTATPGDSVIVTPGSRHPQREAEGGPSTTDECEESLNIACYNPAQLQQAYGLNALYARGITGKGATIVIVEPYGSPTIASDLRAFDRAENVPNPPSLRIIRPAGKVPRYNPGDPNMVGWAGETTLDVEYAHAIAPGASILLVETPVSETEGVHGFPQIVQAEEYVIRHHLGDVISQSFSATEQTFPSREALLGLRGAYTDAARRGVTVLAASGDSGAADVKFDGSTYYLKPVTSWPDSDPLVTAVGGTQLHVTATGKPAAPTVWNDTYNRAANEFAVGNAGPNPLAGGGGRSVLFSRPGYQNGVKNVTGGQRGVPDISMSGACNGSVDTYGTYRGAPPGWSPSCGTSEATPLFAGIVALAAQVAGHPLGPVNPALYRLAAARARGLVDVTKGDNTVSFTQGGKRHRVPGFTAVSGYDLASGVGTVNAAYFVRELAAAAGR